MKTRYNFSELTTIGMYSAAGYLGWRAVPHFADIVSLSVRAPFNYLCNIIAPVSLETSDSMLDIAAALIVVTTGLVKGTQLLSESCQKHAEEHAPKAARLS